MRGYKPLFLILILLATVPQPVLAMGDPGWDYRKSHTITGSIVGEQTDYQVGIKVYYGDGVDGTEVVRGTTFGKVYTDSKCKTDFGDIRFTTEDDNGLDYWIEFQVNSSYALIWVEVDNIPASPDTVDIYIYYGNVGVNTTSNGYSTFIFFDDFEDDTVGIIPSEWAETENPANGLTLTTASGFRDKGVQGTATNVPYRGTREINLSGTYKTGARVKFSLGEYVLMGGATKEYHLTYRSLSTQGNFQVLDAFAVWDDSGVGKDTNWHKIEFYANESTDAFSGYLDAMNYLGDIFGTVIYTSQWGFRFQQIGNTILDDLYGGKWVDPEPAHTSWGEEEEPPPVEGPVTYGRFYALSIILLMLGLALGWRVRR